MSTCNSNTNNNNNNNNTSDNQLIDDDELYQELVSNYAHADDPDLDQLIRLITFLTTATTTVATIDKETSPVAESSSSSLQQQQKASAGDNDDLERIRTELDEHKNESQLTIGRLESTIRQMSERSEADAALLGQAVQLVDELCQATTTTTSEKISSFNSNTNCSASVREHATKLLALVKEEKERSARSLDEARASMQALKANMNAERQIKFNEAIKRATQDKDKLIDELRAKEAAYLEQIRQLNEAVQQQQQQLLGESRETQTEMETNGEDVDCGEYDSATTVGDGEDTAGKALDTLEDDPEKTKSKLRDLMLVEKISQLEKQLALLTTLPITSDYETIQLNSCNIDDLVIAVYSEEYNSYKIIVHKTSSYLHFVHSAIFKSHEQRLSFKSKTINTNSSNGNTTNANMSKILETSEIMNTNENNVLTVTCCSEQPSSPSSGGGVNIRPSGADAATAGDNVAQSQSIVAKNSPVNDDMDNMFMSDKQPDWFVGRVLVKEFCIARRVVAFCVKKNT